VLCHPHIEREIKLMLQVGVAYDNFFHDAGYAAASTASLCVTSQSRAQSVGRDWLQQLCLVNFDASKNHARRVYFILFQRVRTSQRNKTK